MDFKSGPDEKITVKLDGVSFELRQPLVGDLRKLAHIETLPSEKLMDEVISFLSGIGLPEEKLNNLTMKTLIDIFVFVSTPKKSQ